MGNLLFSSTSSSSPHPSEAAGSALLDMCVQIAREDPGAFTQHSGPVDHHSVGDDLKAVAPAPTPTSEQTPDVLAPAPTPTSEQTPDVLAPAPTPTSEQTSEALAPAPTAIEQTSEALAPAPTAIEQTSEALAPAAPLDPPEVLDQKIYAVPCREQEVLPLAAVTVRQNTRGRWPRGLVHDEVYAFYRDRLLEERHLKRPYVYMAQRGNLFARWLAVVGDLWEGVSSETRQEFKKLILDNGLPVRKKVLERVVAILAKGRTDLGSRGLDYDALDMETKALVVMHWAHACDQRTSAQLRRRRKLRKKADEYSEPPKKRTKRL